MWFILPNKDNVENFHLITLKFVNLISLREKIWNAITSKNQYVVQHIRAIYIATMYELKTAFDLFFAVQIVNSKEKDAKALKKHI